MVEQLGQEVLVAVGEVAWLAEAYVDASVVMAAFAVASCYYSYSEVVVVTVELELELVDQEMVHQEVSDHRLADFALVSLIEKP